MERARMTDREWMAYMERQHRRMELVVALGFVAFVVSIAMEWI